MRIEGETVDADIIRIEKSINQSLKNQDTFKSEKDDTAVTGTELKTPVPMRDCLYIFDKASYVAKCSRILAEDILLNEITITPKDNSNEDLNKQISKINEYILDQQDELFNFAVDYYYAGWAAVEYVYNQTTFQLKQIPIHTCRILQDGDIYILEQRINSTTNYFKILGCEYPKNYTYANKELGDVALLGGDNFYQFFTKPLWLQEIDKILTEIAISKKNYNTVSSGNISSGILNINLEPDPVPRVNLNEKGEKVEEDSREKVISDELTNANGGTAVIFTESNREIKLDHVALENNNYEYLNNIQEKSEQAVLNCYNIPLARLMINTEKESMNSNKTQSIWEIYTLELFNKQKTFTKFISELIKELYSFDVDVIIDLPIFGDKRETETSLLLDSWREGALTLKQLITGLSKYIPVIDLKEYDFTVNTDLWNYRKLDTSSSYSDDAEAELNKIEELIQNV